MKQCCSCEQEFEDTDNENGCPHCGSGNWVFGNIDQTPPKCGLVFDNHRGIYMGEAIIQLAESYGMTHEDERTPDHEFYCEAISDAEYWLNKHVAKEGYMFGYGECGDFFYERVEFWDDDEEDWEEGE